MQVSHKNDNLFVKSVHTTQYGIHSLRYTGTNLWNSLSIDVPKNNPLSGFRQNIKNSLVDGYNTVIIIPEIILKFYDYVILNYYLISEVILFI